MFPIFLSRARAIRRGGSHTVAVSKLIETIAAQLERPREITMQVANHLLGSYDVERDVIGDFLKDKLSDLEDYEHDLILSPLFTPKLADQAIFAELLGRESIPRDKWPGLVSELVARPVHAQLVTSDRRTHTITLREVTIERYVYRLRLDGSIPESLFVLLETTPPATDQPTLKAVARRAIWENDAKRVILERYITLAGNRGEYQLTDVVSLMELVESYKPADVAALLAMNRAFTIERENGALDGLLLAPISREALFLGKLLANLAFVGSVELVTLPLFTLFFNVSLWPRLPGILGTTVLATIGFVAVGTIFSAMAVRTRHAELLLPVLLLPFMVPPLIGAVQVTSRLLAGRPWSEMLGWIRLLVLYDIVFVTLCTLIFPAVVDE